MLEMINLVTLLAILVLLVICLHKIRRIHLASYAMAEDIQLTRQETLSLFSQVQALLALERRLTLPKALPAMRGWVGSPDFLLRVAELMLSRQPATVVECSSGISTLVIARTLQMNGSGHLYSLEHDAQYAEKTRSLLVEYGLQEWASVIDAPLVKSAYPSAWYDLNNLPEQVSAIDALVIDGPPSATGPLARYPALPAFADRLNSNPIILADDTDRDDERAMLARWKMEFSEFRHDDLHCEKGCIMLTKGHINTIATQP